MKTSFIVWFVIALVTIMMPAQLATNFELPFDEAIACIGLIVTAYVGISFKASIDVSKINGEVYKDKLPQLTALTITFIIMLLEAIILQYMESRFEFPIGFLFIALGTVGSAYILGRKALMTSGRG